VPVLPATPDAIADAARFLGQGGLVAFPTETVYGLGADATNDLAVAAVFSTKGRPTFNPLIVHVPGLAAAQRFGVFDARAEALARAFWPGPLTIVVKRLEPCPISLLVSAGLDTLAIRCPAHPVALQLMVQTRRPIAAPSANRSGHVSPTTAAHVAEDLGDVLDIILDGGPAEIGLESTVVDVTGDRVTILRPGVISREELSSVIDAPVVMAADAAATASDRPVAPGQLESHYAPRARLRLNAKTAAPGEAFLTFGPAPDAPGQTRSLSPSGNLMEAAANLFAALRALDATGVASIAVMPIPDHGLGHAINDRLKRAAAPRPT
jgi:L-threonylcarbamoyladenylate synthase